MMNLFHGELGLTTHSTLTMRTGAWYGDRKLELEKPDDWDVTILWPETPQALTKNEIADILQKPSGQPSIQHLCEKKSRPLVIVDDLNRPTPAEPVMLILLEYFQDAGMSLKDVTILMAYPCAFLQFPTSIAQPEAS